MFLKIIYFIFVFIFLSCDLNRDPIPISDINQDNLIYKKLELDLIHSDTLKIINPIGESSLLYTGSINDSDYVYSIFSFDYDSFQSYNLCDKDSVSFKKVYLVLDLVNEYNISEIDENINDNNANNDIVDQETQFHPFSAYWLNLEDLKDELGNTLLDENWSESDLKILNNINLSDTLNSFNQDESKSLFVEKYLGKYYIDISDKLIISQNEDCLNYGNESDCIDGCIWVEGECSELKKINICDIENQTTELLLLASNPNMNVIYEFASSDYLSDYNNTEPYLNMVYNEYEEITKQSNKVMINTLIDNIFPSLYISDTLNNFRNTFFVSNFLDDNGNNINHMEINDSLIWSDYDCNSSIDDICIDSLILMDLDSTNQEYKLMNIQVDLINKENFDSTGISFWLDKIKYLEYQSDPHNDNWIDLNENQIWDEDEGTENNQLYDNGEFYQDYGLDKCPDIYEDGQGGCFCEFPFDNCDENLLIYNPEGTENNNQFDDGESYEDSGSDGCYDENERGAILNDDGSINTDLSWLCGLCEPNSINDTDGDGFCDFDPNNDNYNLDPAEDNWIDQNENQVWDDAFCSYEDIANQSECEDNGGQWYEAEGTEDNDKWDDGEPYLDFGLDGLSSEQLGYEDADGTENNGNYDFYDLNGDGIQQANEIGEPYFDYGIDGIRDIDEEGHNPEGTQGNDERDNGEEYQDCGQDNICDDGTLDDDWNINPNQDFWLDCGSDHICPEDEEYISADLNGTERNSIWDNAFCSNEEYVNQLDCESSGSQWYEAEFAEGNSIWNEGEFYQDYGTDQIKDEDELFILDQKINVPNTDSTYYDFTTGVSFYPDYLNQEDNQFKIWISSISQSDISDDILNIEISYTNVVSITGIEFRLNHDIYTVDILDWNKKTRNVAKVDNSSYIKDASIFNNNLYPNSNSLFMNYAYGIYSQLNFKGLDTLIQTGKDSAYILSESNSYLKLFLNKEEAFDLKSSAYIINFNEFDSTETNLLFSYFISNNPDSIIVPIGNLIQNYINNISNYNDGILIGLETNQYPPIFNFNNIVIDTLRPPALELYYFK